MTCTIGISWIEICPESDQRGVIGPLHVAQCNHLRRFCYLCLADRAPAETSIDVATQAKLRYVPDINTPIIITERKSGCRRYGIGAENTVLAGPTQCFVGVRIP